MWRHAASERCYCSDIAGIRELLDLEVALIGHGISTSILNEKDKKDKDEERTNVGQRLLHKAKKAMEDLFSSLQRASRPLIPVAWYW